jgi:hypothetical protein
VSVVDLKETELISELKSVIKSAVIQAIEDAIKPLQDCINKQNDKIQGLGPFGSLTVSVVDLMEASFVRQIPIRDVYEKSFYHERWCFEHYAI